MSDQPINALNVVYNHHAAYELTEIYVGGERGLKPLHRTGKTPEGTIEAFEHEVREIFALAFGADGEEKRGNMLKLKVKFEQSWGKDGTAQRDLDTFLNDIRPGC